MKTSFIILSFCANFLQLPAPIASTDNMPYYVDSNKIICNHDSTIIHTPYDSSHHIPFQVATILSIPTSSSFEIQDKNKYKCGVTIYKVPCKGGSFYFFKQLAIKKQNCVKSNDFYNIVCVKSSCEIFQICCEGNYCNYIKNLDIKTAIKYGSEVNKNITLPDDYKRFTNKICYVADPEGNKTCILMKFNKTKIAISNLTTTVKIPVCDQQDNSPTSSTNFITKYNYNNYNIIIFLQLLAYYFL